MIWHLHHKAVTASTNLDARAGRPGDVFTADEQTAGRGRLDHKWHSAPGENLMCSVVLDVTAREPAEIATLPLVVGLAAAETVRRFVPVPDSVGIKWPNDIWVNGRKIAGILCERHNDTVIAGVGINVNQTIFPPDLVDRATSLRKEEERKKKEEGDHAALLPSPKNWGQTPTSSAGNRGQTPTSDVSNGGVNWGQTPVSEVLNAFLCELNDIFEIWKKDGFSVLWSRLVVLDILKGRHLAVRQTDSDPEPVTGICGGIQPDGTLLVGSVPIYAGEAHVLTGACPQPKTGACPQS